MGKITFIVVGYSTKSPDVVKDFIRLAGDLVELYKKGKVLTNDWYEDSNKIEPIILSGENIQLTMAIKNMGEFKKFRNELIKKKNQHAVCNLSDARLMMNVKGSRTGETLRSYAL